MQKKWDENAINGLSYKVIGAAIEVHRELGPGLLESIYEVCLCKELSLQNLKFKKQVEVPIIYKGVKLDTTYRLDLIVEDILIVELKAIENLMPVHEVQLLTYLRLNKLWLGLFINFNEPVLNKGVRRVVNGKPQ
jgi:GxxExxY protein